VSARLWRRHRRRPGRFLDEVVAIFLDRDAGEADLDRPRRRSLASRASATEMMPLIEILRRSFIVVPSAPRITSPSRIRRPTRSSPSLRGPLGREADEVAILLHDGLGHALLQREAAVFVEVARFAVHRDQDSGPDPLVHGGKLGPAGVAGDVDMGLALGDHPHVRLGQRVLDPADGDFVAGDLPREKITVSSASSLMTWLLKAMRASAARLSPWPPVAMIITSRRGSFIASSKRTVSGKIAKVAVRLRDLENAVERAARDADLRPGRLRHFPSVWRRAALEAKVVTTTLPSASPTTLVSRPEP
jgi:hypothetical protein